MIIVALKLDHTAAVVDPSPIAQGTDSENIVLLSPFPVRCPVMMGWVMPDGSPVEIPLDDTENSPKTRYWNMTNIVLPEGFSGNVQSVWAFKPTANLTAQYGKALACFYVQQPVQSEDPLTHETIQGYKSLTYNPVEINIAETLNPIPDGELDPESPLLEQILAAITYYNTYLTDIEENGVSTVYDTEGDPQREVYTDSEATEDSNNLITSDGVFKAIKEEATRADSHAERYTDEKIAQLEAARVTGVKGSAELSFRHGNVSISKADIGLDEVDNTSDMAKPVSTAQRTAIDTAEQNAKGYADGELALKLDKKPDGVNDLIDGNNKVDSVYLPDYLLGQVLYGGTFAASTGVASLTTNAKKKLGTDDNTITLTNDSSAITGYDANEGIYYIASNNGTFAGISFVTGDWLISNGSSWEKIDNTDAVQSVAGKTGAVVLDKNDVGLGNVDNTSDIDKPVSTLQEQAIQEAERAAKDYADGLSFQSGGTKVYVNTKNSTTPHEALSFSVKYGNGFAQSNTDPEARVEKLYESLSDILGPDVIAMDDLSTVVSSMDRFSSVLGKTVSDQVGSFGWRAFYSGLVPRQASGEGLFSAKKQEDIVDFSYIEVCDIECTASVDASDAAGYKTFFNIGKYLYGVSIDRISGGYGNLKITVYKNGVFYSIDCPYKMNGASCSAVDENKIYIFGTYYDADTETSYNRIVIFDAENETFSCSDKTFVSTINQTDGVAYNGKIYMLAYGSNTTSPLLEYNLTSDVFSVSSLACQTAITATTIKTNGANLYIGTSDGRVLYWDGVSQYLDTNVITISAASGKPIDDIAFNNTTVWVCSHWLENGSWTGVIANDEGTHYTEPAIKILINAGFIYTYFFNGSGNEVNSSLMCYDIDFASYAIAYKIGLRSMDKLVYYNGQVWGGLSTDMNGEICFIHTIETKVKKWYAAYYEFSKGLEWQEVEDKEAAVDLAKDYTNYVLSSIAKDGTPGLTFSVNKSTTEASCTGGAVSGAIVIPDYVNLDGSLYKVTSISDEAFKDNTAITSVRCSKYIRSIGSKAFSNCSQLATFTNGNSINTNFLSLYADVLNVGLQAFSSTAIKYIRLFGTQIAIQNNCFEGCLSLEAIIDFTEWSSYSSNVFKDCTALTSAKFYGKTQLFSGDFNGCTALRDLAIDDNVEVQNYQSMFDNTVNLVLSIYHDGDEGLSATDKGYLTADGVTLREYYRTTANVRKYLHSFKVHSSTVPTSLDPYKMEGEIVIASERDTAYTTVAQILADTTKMYISANGYGLVYSSTGTNVCPLSKVDDSSTAIGIAVFKDNPQQSLLNIFLNDNSTGYTFTDTVMSLE